VKKKLVIGESLEFSFDIRALNGSLGRLRIEYGIDYQKANGTLSRKLFQLSEGDFSGVCREFSRSQSFRQMSTRKHYAGLHRLAILVNGEEKALASFELCVSG
ncbi:MAG: DNA alkylation repair protein, partial [Pontibacterium sp.]